MQTIAISFFLLFTSLSTVFAQRHLFGERLNKRDYDRLAPIEVKKKFAIPTSSNLKPYCPTPVNQIGQICFAYASGYTGRTMLYNIAMNETTNPDKNIFSYGFIVLLAKTSGSLRKNCRGGSSVALACDNMQKYGAIPFSSLKSNCPPKKSLTIANKQEASKYKVISEKLYEQCASPEEKISKIKNALAEKTPVMFGLDVPASFSKKNPLPNSDLWQLTDSDKRNAKCDESGHAMCIVGYDDERYGGTFEIVNSWGTDWKNKGFTYISYNDLALIARYAVRIKNLAVISSTGN